MTEGVFKLFFESDHEQLGSGLAVFKNGEIKGGNTEFLYSGNYQLASQNPDLSTSFNADVTIQYYKGINLALFGKLTRFSAKFSGIFTSNTLVANNKNRAEFINLKGIKIDDVQDSFLDKLWGDSDSLDFVNGEDAILIKTAISLYKNGCYAGAANKIISVIDIVICQWLLTAKEESKIHFTFSEKINVLVEKNIISKKILSLLTELVTHEKILSKQMNSPNDCAFPLCVIAFNSLNQLRAIEGVE